MKFLDLFNRIQKGNYALTEEAIYSSIQNNDKMVPLWGGNKEHKSYERMVSISTMTKRGVPITIFSGEGIIISLDGSAGSMTYKKNEQFALNHHAGCITLKKNATNKVDLEYFALFYQNFYRSLSVSDGSKTLSLQQIYAEEFDLPSYDMQVKIMNKLRNFFEKLNALISIKEKLETYIVQKELWINNFRYQAENIPISQVISYVSGNSGLTEETIYTALNRDGQRFEVLSSATEARTKMGFVPKYELEGKLLKTFENKEGLLVARNGKAGTTRYLHKGFYTINDHAYILCVRDSCPYNINLKWLSIQYKKEFLNYSSSSDNGTWNMTGFFKGVKIDIPEIEEQGKFVSIWDSAEQFLEYVDEIQVDFENLIAKEISIA